MRKLYYLVPVLLIAAGGGWWYMHRAAAPAARFKTATVERGPFMPTISATGTLQPVDAIDVGAEVGGRIDRFGLDPRSLTLLGADALPIPHLLLTGFWGVRTVDFNSPVEENTLLAQIDTSKYEPQVRQAQSQLGQARQDHEQAKIDLIKAEADWLRSAKLANKDGVSQQELEKAEHEYGTAKIKVAKTKEIIDEKASRLKEAQSLLDKTTIRSPTKGVIIARRVNIGQTVVSSLTPPSLFLIASDPRKLQVYAFVNEADIGQIRPGQKVFFTVDASANEVFTGEIPEDQPRLDANMSNNVVTYTVIVNVDNRNNQLKPYLTANLKFVMAQKSKALLIPNGALRWRPQPSQVLSEHREAFLKHSRQRRPPKDDKDNGERFVYVLPSGADQVRPVRVRIGMTDATFTEVLEGDLREGDEVVEGEARHGSNGSDPANPFISNVYGGKKSAQ